MNASPSSSPAVAVLGGGCFWCLDAVFRGLAGVLSVESGYAGGKDAEPLLRSGVHGPYRPRRGRKVTFDPATISFRELLTVFFTIHDPTTRTARATMSARSTVR